ncbi:hypothetical protein Vafri_10854 [Volvox africanus]|uniref:Protein kinase domain-containing protein n=1 Tax=Volvox africanus TaxID=51714 RepID=A0A8J4BB89_9CHLO|nr:hypothetical protein Vafri_10854 [Volvox africanus]
MRIYFPLLLASVLAVSAPASQSPLLLSISSLPTPPTFLRTGLHHQPPLRFSPSPSPPPSFLTMVKGNTTFASILTTCVAHQPVPPNFIFIPTFDMNNPGACGALDEDGQGCSLASLLDVQLYVLNVRRLPVLHVPTAATVLGVLDKVVMVTMALATAAVWQRKAHQASGRGLEGISSALLLLPLRSPSPSRQHWRHRQQQRQQRHSLACRRSLWPSPPQSPSAPSLPPPSLPPPSLPPPSLPPPSLPPPSISAPSLPPPSLSPPSLSPPSLSPPSLSPPSLPPPSLPPPSLSPPSLPPPPPVTPSPPDLSLHSLSLPGPALPTRLSQPSPPSPLPRSLLSSPPPPQPCTPPTQLWTTRGLLPRPLPLSPLMSSTLRPPSPPPADNIRRPAELLEKGDGEHEDREWSKLGPIVDQHPRSRVSPAGGIEDLACDSRSQEEKRDVAVWDEEMGGGCSCTARTLQPVTPERCPVARFSDILIGKEIAEGGCGKIFRGCWLGRDVAVKVPLSEPAMGGDEAKLKRQIGLEVAAMMAAPPHPNVLQLLAASLEGPGLALVLDYLAPGCLFGMLYGPQRPAHGLPCSVLLRILLGVARGMAWLHHHNVVHRDLKPENILLDTCANPKIADFGLAAVLQDRQQLLTSRMGSTGWVAPEILKGLPYDKKVDVYSFGIIIWECLAGKRPYEGLTNDQVMFAVAAGFRPPVPPDTDPELEQLMCACWAQDPEQRPAFQDIARKLQMLLQQTIAAGAEL